MIGDLALNIVLYNAKLNIVLYNAKPIFYVP